MGQGRDSGPPDQRGDQGRNQPSPGSDDAPAAPDPLLTVSEVADELRLSNMTVYRLINRGELPAVRIGRSYRIRRSQLRAYLEARTIGPEHSEQG